MDHCGYVEVVKRLKELGGRLREEFEIIRSLRDPEP
jgi:hypothetical protein